MRKRFASTISKAASLGAIIALGACASQPDKIQAQYVSPIQYESYDCDQLGEEARRVNGRASELHASLKKTADADAAQMGIGLVLLWPTLLLLEGGDGVEAQEYARLKGERDAIETVSIRKKCGITFEPLAKPEIAAAEPAPRKNWAKSESAN